MAPDPKPPGPIVFGEQNDYIEQKRNNLIMPGIQRSILSEYLGDPEFETIFGDAEYVREILAVEVLLADAQAGLDMIPADAAEAIRLATASFSADINALAIGLATDGAIIGPLLHQVRPLLPEAHRRYLHYGATSQDIMDIALVRILKRANAALRDRLKDVCGRIAGHAEAHRDCVTVSRTRQQHALPQSYALKVAMWLPPLYRAVERLRQMSPRLYRMQWGGAGGTLASYGDKGIALGQALSKKVGLEYSGYHWQNQGDILSEYAGWLSMVSGGLGKIAQDLIYMTQTDIGEIRLPGGGSSAMPHKQNPVLCEAIVSLAIHNTGLLTNMHMSMLNENERDGRAWGVEWLNLPQMVVAAATGLRHTSSLFGSIQVNRERMRHNLERTHGLVYSEAARIELERTHDDAGAIIRQACETAAQGGRTLVDVLSERLPDVDWPVILQADNLLGSAREMTDRILRENSML